MSLNAGQTMYVKFSCEKIVRTVIVLDNPYSDMYRVETLNPKKCSGEQHNLYETELHFYPIHAKQNQF